MIKKPIAVEQKAYLTPSCRFLNLVSEINFLASGEGEDMDPVPGTWDDFNF
ncbi:MAG: hypothetical protein II130_04565 [Bacteroidales bacterium]|jgi:hypothetical protein|nr:hypothetical protein [Bacteroidales bacterium]